MRASPLGVFAASLGLEETVALARADSALTHPHRVCGDAVAAFVVAVRHAVRHGSAPGEVFEAARDWAREAGADPVVRQALDAAAERPPRCDGEHPGFVAIALQNAFYELRHARSLEEALVSTVRRGGDTDTNAAIAGALLGAVHGRDAVPPDWRVLVLSCRPHPLRAPRPRPMACWPVDVLEQAERLLLASGRARLPGR
jgi:ADP-ribosylglycohydrolase